MEYLKYEVEDRTIAELLGIQNFTNEDIINLLKKHNVNVKEERGNRIFPVSDKSKDVLDAFYEELKNLNVKNILI